MRTFISFIFISLLYHSALTGQNTWDLQRCINQAQNSSLSIQQANIAVDQAEINKKIAKHSRYPSLNGSSNLSWNFGRSIDPTSNQFISETFFSNNVSLNTGVTLYNGGRIKNRIKQSEIDQKASQEDAEDTRRNIALNVASLYLNVLFAKDNVRIAQTQYDLAVNQLSQINKLIAAGSRPENDRLDIEAQITNAEQSKIQAENIYTINILNLKQQLRLEADASFEVVTPPSGIKLGADPDLLTFEEVYSQSLNNQPALKASEYRQESALLDEKIAKAALLPSLTLGGSLGTNYSNKGLSFDGFETQRVDSEIFINDVPVTLGIDQTIPLTSKAQYFTQLDENVSYGVGFGLNIPIYNNYNNKGNVERAKLGIENARINNEQLKENFKIEVQQAIADAKAAKRAYQVAERNLAAQAAAFDNAQKRFDLGSINTYDYNNALNAKENADINLLIAKYDYIFKTKIIDFYLGRPLNIN